jgi:hypothetical protein
MLYYSANSNNCTPKQQRTDTHTYISTLGEQLFHQQYVTSNPYPLLPTIVAANLYTRQEYKTLIVDHDVPYVSSSDQYNQYIDQTLPINTKWNRFNKDDTTPTNPVTISCVLLTSAISSDPASCDYTVFFSNNNILLAQSEEHRRNKRAKKSKTSKENNVTPITSQPYQQATPSANTRQSTAKNSNDKQPLSTSSMKSSTSLTPKRPRKPINSHKLFQQYKFLLHRDIHKWFKGTQISETEWKDRGIFRGTILYSFLVYELAATIVGSRG